MKEDIGLLAMDGDIGSTARLNGVWRGRDILIISIFLARLACLGLDSSGFLNICVGYRELYEMSLVYNSVFGTDLWVLNSLHEIRVDVFNFRILSGCRIRHDFSCTLLAMWLAGCVIPGITAIGLLSLHLLLELCISLLLVLVQALDEFLDVGNGIRL